MSVAKLNTTTHPVAPSLRDVDYVYSVGEVSLRRLTSSRAILGRTAAPLLASVWYFTGGRSLHNPPHLSPSRVSLSFPELIGLGNLVAS